jgi:chemotaxis protein CheX
MSESQIPEISSLEASLRDAIKEVAGTSFGASPEFVTPFESAKGMSAIIGMSGDVSGYLAVHLSPEDACKIAGAMLGDTYTEVDDIVCDAVGEVVNMLGGSLKKFSGKHGEPFRISVPTIVRGKDYETHAAKDAEQVLFGISVDSVCCFTVQLVVYSH